jgi:hypothetical protein
MASQPEQSTDKQPVVVVTDWHMVRDILTAKGGKNTTPSPINDESIWGYPSDTCPKRNGVQEIKEVVHILQAASIPCCLVGEAALIYYGTGRILHVRSLYDTDRLSVRYFL